MAEAAAAATTEPTAPVTEPADDFDSVFDSLTLPTGDPAAPEPTTPETPAATEGEAPDEGDAVEEPEAPAAPATPAATSSATPATPAPAADDVVAKLLERLNAQPTTPAAPATPAVVEPEAPLFTVAEEKVLQDYEKEWPEVAAGVALQQRKLANDIINHVFTQVEEFVRPFIQMTQATAVSSVAQELESRVPDYETVREPVAAWVKALPTGILRTAYEEVIRAGTVDEVVQLIDQYKLANNVAPVAPKPRTTPAVPAAPAARKTDTELPSTVKQAAAAMAPVGSKRSAVSTAADPNDFNSAFERAARDNT